MNVSLFIAKRYLFSKKSTHAINIISAVSSIGVAVATMALMVTLSVFNGFHDLVASFLTQFDPQLKVVPVQGKTIMADDPVIEKIKGMEEIDVATECIEDQALAFYYDRQAMVTIKGVEDNFTDLTHIRDILYGDGIFDLHAAELEYGVPGIQLAQTLGTGARWNGYLKIYAPRRDGQLDELVDPSEGFVEDSLLSPGAVFSVHQSRYDQHYLITSIGFARRIFGAQGEISSLEIRIKEGYDLDRTKKKMQELAGEKCNVLDRYEQQSDTFAIMKVEKLIAYIFLTFILLVACFNIISSLSMLMVDKKEDVKTLHNLGANDKLISRIFMYEGWLNSFIGAIVGIGIGLLLCWLQQEYGLVRLGDEEGTFIINSYPVSVHPSDIVLVLVTVIVTGLAATWYPVRYFTKNQFE